MTALAKRSKAPALAVPQSIDEAAEMLRLIGEEQRAVEAIETQLGKDSAALKTAAETEAKPHKDALTLLEKRLQGFADARRGELLKDGGKTVELASGKFGWRTRPPSVKLPGKGKDADKAEAVIAWLRAAKALVFKGFLRRKWELNKEALLANPEKAKEVPGVEIITGVEDFWLEPAAMDLAPAQASLDLEPAS